MLSQPSAYAELARALGELRGAGEKGHRALLGSVLPRLAQMEGVPSALVPQLLQLRGAGDDRCACCGSPVPPPGACRNALRPPVHLCAAQTRCPQHVMSVDK